MLLVDRIGPTLRAMKHYTFAQMAYRALRPIRWRLASRAGRTVKPEPIRFPSIGPAPVVPPGVAVMPDEVHVHGFTLPIIPDQSWESPQIPELAKLQLHYLDWLAAPEMQPETAVSVLRRWQQVVPLGHAIAWSPYAIATRLMFLVKFAQTLTNYGFGNKNLSALIAGHTAYLTRAAEWDVGGNHLVRSGAALVMGGTMLSGGVGRRAKRLGSKILHHCMQKDLLSDGGYRERTVWYHTLVLSDLIDAMAASTVDPDGNETALELAKAIKEMASWLTQVRGVGGRYPLFGDSCEDVSWYAPAALEGADEQGISVSEEVPGFAVLPDTHWFRVTLNGLSLAGNLGLSGDVALPGHGHGDGGSFELWSSEAPLIVDQGTLTYGPGAARDKSRATASHNTLTIDESEQLEYWNAFRVGRRAVFQVLQMDQVEVGRGVVEAEFETSCENGCHFVHRRSFEWDEGKRSIEITDVAVQPTSARRGRHEIVRRFRFADGVVVVVENDLLIAEAKGVVLQVKGDGIWDVQYNDEWWPRWGDRRRATLARLRAFSEFPWQGKVLIAW